MIGAPLSRLALSPPQRGFSRYCPRAAIPSAACDQFAIRSCAPSGMLAAIAVWAFYRAHAACDSPASVRADARSDGAPRADCVRAQLNARQRCEFMRQRVGTGVLARERGIMTQRLATTAGHA